jgi:hypothetical protein
MQKPYSTESSWTKKLWLGIDERKSLLTTDQSSISTIATRVAYLEQHRNRYFFRQIPKREHNVWD